MAELQSIEHMEDWFGAVVFLTRSDWKTEPRSNRYHYAKRFARRLPVFFVQPDQIHTGIFDEPSGEANITLVHCSWEPDPQPDFLGRERATPSETLIRYLRSKNIWRPLIWVYNCQYEGFLEATDYYKVFHASEDFTLSSDTFRVHSDERREQTLRALGHCDMMVAVSESVRQNYLAATGFAGPSITLNNGCDFEFWQASGAAEFTPAALPKPKFLARLTGAAAFDSAKVALYQGGINIRLDFALIETVATALPDWSFWFCGVEDQTDAFKEGMAPWARIAALPNVTYHGVLDAEGIADLSRQATVGLIPFKNVPLIHLSLPLKAYEYVACGLPVVTVPIKALEGQPDIFAFADTPEAFVAAICKAGPTRTDPKAIERRLAAAKTMDYDARFAELNGALVQALEQGRSAQKSLNILVLYDDRHANIKTIEEHLSGLSRYSKHQYFFFPVAEGEHHWVFEHYRARWPEAWDLSLFDAVVWHYGLPASLAEYMSALVADKLAAYDGLKVLFIQDEYENTNQIGEWVRQAGISLVMTCVPLDGVDYVYGGLREAGVEFRRTLTGYVPEDETINRYGLPMEERKIRLGYRGRTLSYHYGDLAQEKYRIGVEMKRLTKERGVSADIEVDDTQRIYGSDWYKFLGSVRATLATESGANIFDFEGRLRPLAMAAQKDGTTYEAFAAEHLTELEGQVMMNQVSPKIFEAIRLRTALVCFEGSYSGVITAEVHYIPLKKDFSNVDEVLAKLEDTEGLKALTDRAYRDVIESGKYSFQTFVKDFDNQIEQRLIKSARTRLISAPVVAKRRGGEWRRLERRTSFEYILNDSVLGGEMQRRDLERILGAPSARPVTAQVSDGSDVVFVAGPDAIVCYEFWSNAGAVVSRTQQGAVIMTPMAPWHYAAGVQLPLSELNLQGGSIWLRLLVGDSDGKVLVSLFNGGRDALDAERPAPLGVGPHELFFELKDKAANFLLFRNGPNAKSASLTFLEAQIISRRDHTP